MATSFGALCTDFYINLTVAMKMDLPCERESIMGLFDRVRKVRPNMDKFRRYDDELALESSRRDAEYTWLALRQNSIRTGHVNPDSMEDAYDFHRMILQTVPYYLTISPLDVDFVELLFGFDLECQGNHDEVVYEALYADTPLGNLLDQPLLPEQSTGSGPSRGRTPGRSRSRDFGPGNSPDSSGDSGGGDDLPGDGGTIIDVQPIFRVNLTDSGDLQAMFEVKTRERSRRGNASRSREEPLSLFVSLRQFGPIMSIDDLQPMLDTLGRQCETLATDRLIPSLLTPIARQITSSNA